MLKRTLLLALLAGCSAPEEEAALPADRRIDRELQAVRNELSVAQTVRIRFKGEWPCAVGRMPRGTSGTVLLGEGGKARMSLTVHYPGGGSVVYEAVSDGSRIWKSPTIGDIGFDPGPGGLRHQLLYSLAWYGVGWSFPHGPHPKTIGQGYVICDLVPQERDRSPSRREPAAAGVSAINHECGAIDYRVRLLFDASTSRLRKRELIGEKDVVWYVENYLDVQLGAPIPDDEFKLPG